MRDANKKWSQVTEEHLRMQGLPALDELNSYLAELCRDTETLKELLEEDESAEEMKSEESEPAPGRAQMQVIDTSVKQCEKSEVRSRTVSEQSHLEQSKPQAQPPKQVKKHKKPHP